MSMSLFELALLGAGVVFLIGGVVFSIVAAKTASAGRTALAEANIRLAASQELATEVRRLTEKVEASLQHRDASIENAFLRHNDACAASMREQLSASAPHHDDDDDDDHHKHHSGGHHDDDDDDDHHKHHASMNGHDDDDDDDHKHHHAAKPSLMARLFGRTH
jgi:hypothetical protein